MSQTITIPETLIDNYIAIWNETDPEKRRALIAQVWAENGNYRDPLLEATGHDGIEAMTAGFQAQYPGHTFERIPDSVDGNQFGWKLVEPEGTVFVTGVDTAELDDTGRFTSIIGTFNQ
jgi:hypothetical protein